MRRIDELEVSSVVFGVSIEFYMSGQMYFTIMQSYWIKYHNRRFLAPFIADAIEIREHSLFSFVFDAHGMPSNDVVPAAS